MYLIFSKILRSSFEGYIIITNGNNNDLALRENEQLDYVLQCDRSLFFVTRNQKRVWHCKYTVHLITSRRRYRQNNLLFTNIIPNPSENFETWCVNVCKYLDMTKNIRIIDCFQIRLKKLYCYGIIIYL